MAEECEWRMMCVVKGYHVYMSKWEPYVEDTFYTKHEKNNPHNKYAIAVSPDDSKQRKITGHLLREIDCVLMI